MLGFGTKMFTRKLTLLVHTLFVNQYKYKFYKILFLSFKSMQLSNYLQTIINYNAKIDEVSGKSACL